MKSVYQQALDFLAQQSAQSKPPRAASAKSKPPRAASAKSTASATSSSTNKKSSAPHRRRGQSSSAPRAIDRHSRKCNVCRHPSREAIEQEFLRWRSPDNIALDYGIADHSSIYRHAHAHNLFARRDRKLRSALEFIIERSANVRPTADSVVRAVCVFACINDSGQWIDPRRQPPRAPSLSPSDTNRT